LAIPKLRDGLLRISIRYYFIPASEMNKSVRLFLELVAKDLEMVIELEEIFTEDL